MNEYNTTICKLISTTAEQLGMEKIETLTPHEVISLCNQLLNIAALLEPRVADDYPLSYREGY